MTLTLPAWLSLFSSLPDRHSQPEEPPPLALHEYVGLPRHSGQAADAAALRQMMCERGFWT